MDNIKKHGTGKAGGPAADRLRPHTAFGKELGCYFLWGGKALKVLKQRTIAIRLRCLKGWFQQLCAERAVRGEEWGMGDHLGGGCRSTDADDDGLDWNGMAQN